MSKGLDLKIQHCLSWFVNGIAECYVYNQSDQAIAQHLEGWFEKFYTELKQRLDFSDLDVETARELRMAKWDEDSDLWLFPLWLVPALPDGLEVITISGQHMTIGEDTLDNDIRFGCVAYGIEITE